MKLTELARKTIELHFLGNLFQPDEKTKEKYKDKKACFVTLTKRGSLRGCIGSLEARQELWKDVQENSINSGFYDTRFAPLTKDELDKIKIEVSVLSKHIKLNYKNEKDLLNKLDNKMGVILKKDNFSSTFLPQVWEQILDKTEFLENLSLKAGLNKDAWKKAEIWYYYVEIEKEGL